MQPQGFALGDNINNVVHCCIHNLIAQHNCGTCGWGTSQSHAQIRACTSQYTKASVRALLITLHTSTHLPVEWSYFKELHRMGTYMYKCCCLPIAVRSLVKNKMEIKATLLLLVALMVGIDSCSSNTKAYQTANPEPPNLPMETLSGTARSTWPSRDFPQGRRGYSISREAP